MADSALKQHADIASDLLASGKYSDLIITCGSDTYKVHKSIVCTRCGFFERAERFGKEATDGIINLPEDEPAMIALLLEFLYTSEYQPCLSPKVAGSAKVEELVPQIPQKYRNTFPHTCSIGICCANPCKHHNCSWDCFGSSKCSKWICEVCCPPALDSSEKTVFTAPEGSPEQLLLHSKLYTIADKYDVPGLKNLAHRKFYYGCKAFGTEKQFVVAAEHAFSTTPDEDEGLRCVIRGTLIFHKSILGRADVKDFLKVRPALMYDIMLRVAK